MKITTVAIFNIETSSLYVNNYQLSDDEAIYQAMVDSGFVYEVPTIEDYYQSRFAYNKYAEYLEDECEVYIQVRVSNITVEKLHIEVEEQCNDY